jgi:hypothetical protein
MSWEGLQSSGLRTRFLLLFEGAKDGVWESGKGFLAGQWQLFGAFGVEGRRDFLFRFSGLLGCFLGLGLGWELG